MNGMPEQQPVAVRAARPGDLAALHAINEAATPGVGTIAPGPLAALIEGSLATLVAERGGIILGFVLCLGEGVDYGSPNFLWFRGRYPAFAYVDRIAVAEEARGLGIGAALYEALIAELGGTRPVLTCEVNTLPPNPGSMRFHGRLGFTPVGAATYEVGRKAVAFLARPLAP